MRIAPVFKVPVVLAWVCAVTVSHASAQEPFQFHYDVKGYDAQTGTYDLCRAIPIPDTMPGSGFVAYCTELNMEEDRLRKANCPVDVAADYQLFMHLSQKRFEQCENLIDAGSALSATYDAINLQRLDDAARHEWDRNKAHCLRTPGCIVVEGHIENE